MHISQFPLSFIPLISFLFFLSSLQLLTTTAHHSMVRLVEGDNILRVQQGQPVQAEDEGSNSAPLYMDKSMHACKAGLNYYKTSLQYPFSSCSIVFACYIHSLAVLLTCSYHTARASLEVQARITLTHHGHGHPFISSLTSLVGQRDVAYVYTAIILVQ